MKELTFGIVAHVDSGKTTLSEALLYTAGEIRNIGRVDHKNAHLDTHSIEKNRGITIFSKQARFKVNSTYLTLIDTPGHIDFSAETERALQVLDYAVLVISGTDGVQSHSETLWTLLTRYNIPTFIFINKMDVEVSEKDKIMAELKEKLSTDCVDFSIDTKDENIALCSEKLMDEYLEYSKISELSVSKAIKNRIVFPCFWGSALKLLGIEQLFAALDSYTAMPNYPKKFGAKVYKISWDEQGNRLTHIKITGGSLKVKAVVFGKDKNDNEWQEKVNQIRIYNGVKFETPTELFAGAVCAVTGLSKTYAGEGLGIEKQAENSLLKPVLSYKVLLPFDIDPHHALHSLRILEQEDPQLYVRWNETIKEIELQLMGAVQIEVLSEVVKNRFGFDIAFDSGNIVYKETIAQTVHGAGHFEPLRHYAEVHLTLEPLKSGSGIIIDSTCRHDELAMDKQRLIISHLLEKSHTGILTNSEITDIKITLTHAIEHQKHTQGGDFREATYRALRQALLKSTPILLEPFYDFDIEIPTDNLGRVLSDIGQMGGKCESPQIKEETSYLKGILPVSTGKDYAGDIVNFTKGKGKISLKFNSYLPCHNSAEVIKKFAYDALSDNENTGHSVFCSHGSGFVVKWDEADKHMHYNEQKASTNSENKSVRRKTSITDISEKELLEIFEKTYGAIKKDPRVKIKKPIVQSADVLKVNRAKPIPEGPLYVLVDGYNIIFAWDELKKMSETNLDLARSKLCDMLCNYCAYHRCELILVFDAYKVKGNVGSVEKYHNISVVYTKEAETADMYIEKVTQSIGRKHRVKVATSDNLQQMIILGHGATRVSARAFKQEVLDAEKSIREIIEEYSF